MQRRLSYKKPVKKIRSRFEYNGFMNGYIALRILDLKPPITKEIIKERYRFLVTKWHPDKQNGNNEIMQGINAAVDYLEQYVR